jgi:hypothetical protein
VRCARTHTHAHTKAYKLWPMSYRIRYRLLRKFTTQTHTLTNPICFCTNFGLIIFDLTTTTTTTTHTFSSPKNVFFRWGGDVACFGWHMFANCPVEVVKAEPTLHGKILYCFFGRTVVPALSHSSCTELLLLAIVHSCVKYKPL